MQQSCRGDEEPVVYELPNKLKDKVTLGGRIKGNGYDPKLLARADAHVAAMADTLLQAMDYDMKRLEHACQQAENVAEEVATNLRELEKVAHEIKRYGDNIGFDLLTRFGYSLSLFLRKPDLGEATKVRVARAHVDSMNLVFRHKIKGNGGAAGDKLTSALNLAVSKFLSAK